MFDIPGHELFRVAQLSREIGFKHTQIAQKLEEIIDLQWQIKRTNSEGLDITSYCESINNASGTIDRLMQEIDALRAQV